MHDYNYRFAQFCSVYGKDITIDMHRIIAVNGSEVILEHNVRIELAGTEAEDLSITLLNMNKDFEEA